MKKNKNSLRFILRKDRKPNEMGEYPVCIYYSVKKVPIKKSMGIFIRPELWLGDDGDTSKYILEGEEGHPKAPIYNKVLSRKKDKIEQILEELESDRNFVMTVPMMRSIMNGKYKAEVEAQKGKVPFIDEVLNYNHNMYLKGKIGYSVWFNIQNQMSLFRKFLQQEKKLETSQKKILYCCQVTVEIIEEYIKWRKERGNGNQTINKSLTPIFKTVKKLMQKGWIKREIGEEILDLYLPVQSKSLSNPTEGDIDYLTFEQVKMLIELTEQSKYPRTKELMDMFLFSLHCGGMRFSDVCTLRWMEINIEERLIKHMQVKNHTKRPIVLNLPISGDCMKILQRWVGKFDNFVYGQLPDEFDLDNIERLKHYLNSKNKTINQSLQCLGEKMKLPFRLHFHTARHTFACWAINRGVDLKTISYLMGHSTSSVTEKVYAKLFPDTVAETVRDKLDFKLY